MTAPTAISGTRRAMKELVDGTIRVSVDIDPRFRADFHRLFPNIDTAIALTPLIEQPMQGASATPEKAAVHAAKPARFPDGLCGLAVQWSQDVRFHEWLQEVYGREWHVAYLDHCTPEGAAKAIILDFCRIESRKDLDTNPEAGERFEKLIRGPFRKVLAEE